MVQISITLAILVLVVLLALGVPAFAAVGWSAVAFLNTSPRLSPLLIADGMFTGIDSFALIAIPLFIFTGDALLEAGVADELLDFAESLVGGFNSGLGTATILGCGFFATISGSSSADAGAIGRVTLNRLEQAGYTRSYASAMVASGASTGVLIPPSITYIVAGIALGLSASTLFTVAFIPGVLVLLSIIITNIFNNRRKGYEKGSEFGTPRNLLGSAWDAKFGILVPVVILGGIYSGIFTPTESAAVAIGLTLIIGEVVGTIELQDYPIMLERSAVLNGMITPIIAVGIVLSQVLASIGIPELVAASLMAITQNFYLLTILMLVVFLIAGAIMDITPNVIILGPLFLPVAQQIGMSAFHFAVFFMTALSVGFITPPIGLNLYVLSGVSDEPILQISKNAVPFMIAMVLTVLVLGWIPGLYMWVIS